MVWSRVKGSKWQTIDLAFAFISTTGVLMSLVTTLIVLLRQTSQIRDIS
jgi:hypothetical protein